MNWNSKKNPLGNYDNPTPPMWWNIQVREEITKKRWLPEWNWLGVASAHKIPVKWNGATYYLLATTVE